MTLGPLMVDVQGTVLDGAERELLKHPLVGGVILFSRNYESPEQVTALCADIHSLREPALLIAVDQEGGRVQRFREGFTRLPAMAHLGHIHAKDRKRALRLADVTGWCMAAELRGVGIDLSFAPVLDIDRGVSTVIGDRALHRDPQIVSELAHAYMNGMQRAGMAATGKHFPGHGSVRADTHISEAVDERDYPDIAMDDMLAFERMIHYGLPALMMAHVTYPRVDKLPAGFSRVWVQDVLRQRLGFQGAVFSDDLTMTGAMVAGDIVERTRLTLDAGCDMALICNHPQEAARVAQRLEFRPDAVSGLRLVRLHGKSAPDREALRRSRVWRETVADVERYNEELNLELNL